MSEPAEEEARDGRAGRRAREARSGRQRGRADTEGERSTRSRAEQLAEIRSGLAKPQKELPSKLFYDRRGSELFERITRLPEYYLTRAEEALLRSTAPEWVSRIAPRTLVELGAGSAEKTRIILDAMIDIAREATYVPVDISAGFLEATAETLRRRYPEIEVVPVVADFTRSPASALQQDLPRPVLVTFLGSTIGNLEFVQATSLLRSIREAMKRDDRFLLGVDLRKDVDIIEAAYNDAAGVTAEFNLNVLHVLNREFGANFRPDRYRHRAAYDDGAHRIEMHLVATEPQTVHIPGCIEIRLETGETIRTEISCKYDRAEVTRLFGSAGFDVAEWAEGEDGRFALALGVAGAERGPRGG